MKLIYNSLTDDSDLAFNISWNHEEKPIIGKIVSSKFFFGIYRNSILEGDIKCLRCYTDNSISYKSDYWDKNCEYLRSLNGPSSVKRINNLNDIVVYPNPFDSHIFIGGTMSMNYAIYNSTGELILEGNDNSVKTGNLGEGIYFLKIWMDDKIQVVKILKQLP